MFERSFLEPFAGSYKLSDFTYLITLRPDNVLTYTTPAGSVYELQPVRGNTFSIKGLSGTSITFQKDSSGRVTEAALAQPGATTVLKRQ